MKPETHLRIDHATCGAPTAFADGRATVALDTTAAMAVDDHGLVHGGFVFGAVDHAAMLAVNHPNVVLGSASVKLTAPVRAGDRVVCEATRTALTGRKHELQVEARVGDRVVMTGTMTAFVLDRHVLDPAPG